MEIDRTIAREVPISDQVIVGADQIVMMAGPCAVETHDQMYRIAEAVHAAGGRVLRGGAYKPRSSPHTFQGLGLDGLKIMREVADEFGLLVVTEALGIEHIDSVIQHADIIQIGSRNMQHFPLLWAVGETNTPILLKRGFMATIEEWVLAAEHIRQRGNDQIILCERGIRGFDPLTRNVLDVNAIPLARKLSGLPVIADPSHATGRTDLIIPASMAAVAAGADGLLVEVHPDPANALSDKDQALPLEQLPELFDSVAGIAEAVGRKI